MASSTILPALIMRSLDTSGNEPNKAIGYRTKASMRSNETWFYAQKRSAELMTWNVLVVLSIQILSFVLLSAEGSVIATTIGVVLSIAALLTVVEVELRKKFDKEGKPKSSTIIRGD